MKRTLRIAIIPIALAGIIFTFSCSDSEHRIPFGATRVVIDLNLPDSNSASGVGVIEHIRRFFLPDAVAQSAPASFSSIKVRVTGPDIALIEKSFAPYSSISMSVPAGSFRNFEVIAYVASGDPSAAASFRGTAAANCPMGSTVNVPVVMGLYETKIIVPDYYNYRIVSITNMDGNYWVDRASLPGVASLQPNDIDFDSVGRIYIANYATQGLIRIDNMVGDNIIISDLEHFGDIEFIQSVAVDRKNNIVYFSTFSALYRSKLDGSDTLTIPLPFSPIPIQSIQGLGTDSAGHLYIAGEESAGLYRIFKCSIEGTTLTVLGTPLNDPYLNYALDVMVQGSSIYVANQGGMAGYKILRVIEGPGEVLEIAEHYGTSGFTTDPGVFYGPQRFLAIRNDGLIIGDSNMTQAKLVSMGDMSGGGWTTYGTVGPGEDQFRLWAQC